MLIFFLFGELVQGLETRKLEGLGKSKIRKTLGRYEPVASICARLRRFLGYRPHIIKPQNQNDCQFTENRFHTSINYRFIVIKSFLTYTSLLRTVIMLVICHSFKYQLFKIFLRNLNIRASVKYCYLVKVLPFSLI